MADHALLSASSSHRWLNCPPSAKLCAAHPDRASPYAQQGTDAHSLAAYKVQKALGMAARDPTEDLDYFDSEMDYRIAKEKFHGLNEYVAKNLRDLKGTLEVEFVTDSRYPEYL